MKMEANYVLACEYGTIDRKGLMSAIGIFDQITLSKDGTKILSFFVLGKFFVKDSEGTVADACIEVLDNEGERVGEPVVLKNASATANEDLNIFVRMNLIEFKKQGQHSIRVKHGDSVVYTAPIFNVIKPQQQ